MLAGGDRGPRLLLRGGRALEGTLERLAALQEDGTDPQRIGLSATQNPLEEVAKYMVGPRRTARIVDAGVRQSRARGPLRRGIP